MSDAERAKAEAGDWQKKYEAEASEHGNLKAKLAFFEAGASDADSVLLHWNSLPAEEREKTTPADFAKALAKTKGHLFAKEKSTDTGPSPEGDGGTPPGKPKVNHRPQTAEDKKNLKAAWAAMGSRR